MRILSICLFFFFFEDIGQYIWNMVSLVPKISLLWEWVFRDIGFTTPDPKGQKCPFALYWASLVVQMVKNMSTMHETQVQSLVWEQSIEKGMATHSVLYYIYIFFFCLWYLRALKRTLNRDPDHYCKGRGRPWKVN